MYKITYIYNRVEYIPQIIDYINKKATLLNPDTNETFDIELRELGVESEATKRICDKAEEILKLISNLMDEYEEEMRESK